ncbi:amidohydrolase family protein [Flavobacterium oreochromis]|uniref:Amidohydrolase family protein n=1 Tax=Flavobacterium oreochromis TaxID=2906078 RepID=A0ABW8PAQ1_9FLAO|nr:amidohydrolase family protein [Flavobacterium oreochromis]OWP76690.1 amidohydrolase [Flavobacterium oreochromis]
MKKIVTFLFLNLTFLNNINSQEYFPNNESVKTNISNYTAFINAKIYVTPSQIIEKGALLIKEGKIIEVGQNLIIPKNTITVDLNGKTIYPSFIDLYTNFGVETIKYTNANRTNNPLYDTKRKGYYWNEHIKSEKNVFEVYKYDSQKAEEFLKAGFGVLGTHIPDGIARGTGALIFLNNENETNNFLEKSATNHFSLTRSSSSNQAYPSSLMGALALLKQMYHDASWYQKGNSEYKDASLQALIQNQKLVQIFDSEDKLNTLRVAKIGKQFGVNYIFKGSGNEFERIEDIKKIQSKLIIPINFPEVYDVSDPYIANQMELADLRFWNQAPLNPKILADNGIVFALTTDKLKKIDDFKTNLLKAIAYGFSKKTALEALTTVPADLLGKSNEIGSLKAGAYANFLITSGDIFDPKTTLFENWVNGKKNIINDLEAKDPRGNYYVTFKNENYNMKIEGEINAPKIEIKNTDNKKINAKLTVSNNWMNILLQTADTTKTEFNRLTGFISDSKKIIGKVVTADGLESTWEATQTDKFIPNNQELEDKKLNKIFPVTFPNLPYGNIEKPHVKSILFKNATVWTNEKEGILTETDVLVKNGKIAAIGKNIKEDIIENIDAKGKHLTSGIIDEHSHIAISSGVNEGGHNSSAEVTIEDVVNSDDVNIYRNLAGGVTTSQLLHGSANPIGGRSAIVRWKWGLSPDEMIFQNSPQFIKFALGENVKQSNWGISDPTRFPQTRMGVEQVFIDYFTRALEYDKNWKQFNAQGKSGIMKQPRVDIELQTIAEIINRKRFISCHSYVQSEILSLMRIAEKFNFKVNTFTHILEGYKVANEMKEHGVGASTFSDWWAYKYEVNDAIPYNASILHKKGILVAINSDDAEMSRRLNQEAAKIVKYGGVSEEEAWKMVTLNPAKLLHLDHKIGSIKIGKDADLVLWDDNPLSVYAKVDKTMIEGVVYYDKVLDEKHRKSIQLEKKELINQMLQEKNQGAITRPATKTEKKHYHCDTMENY